MPFATAAVSIAVGAGIALCGHLNTAWRLWTVGGLVSLSVLQAALSWRYVWIARGRLLNAISEASTREPTDADETVSSVGL